MKLRKRVACQDFIDVDDYIENYVSETLDGTLKDYTINDRTKKIVVTYTDYDGKQHTLYVYDVCQ